MTTPQEKTESEWGKPTKADLAFAKKLQEVITGLNRRMGKKMCKELHSACWDCKTRILIGFLNEWIDNLIT